MPAKKFRKKPVVIEALRFTAGGTNEHEIREFFGDAETFPLTGVSPGGLVVSLSIHTLEGDMKVDDGDWIIRGVQGELYPCKPDIFAATYQAIDYETWRCPGCWERWPVEMACPHCEGKMNIPGLFRHPPIDPVTCEVSAADNAILLGELRHCDTPAPWLRDDCFAVMDEHGWIDDGSPHGVTVCPPDA